MQNITSYVRLQNAIELLEDEQDEKKQLLKEQLNYTLASLKPLNLLINALTDIHSSPNLIDNVLGSTIGLASGYLSKRIFVGTSGNLIRKIFGSVLQLGVTGFVAQHPDSVKLFSQFILEHLIRKKETNSNNRVRRSS
jgi:hypothetical protein